MKYKKYESTLTDGEAINESMKYYQGCTKERIKKMNLSENFGLWLFRKYIDDKNIKNMLIDLLYRIDSIKKNRFYKAKTRLGTIWYERIVKLYKF